MANTTDGVSIQVGLSDGGKDGDCVRVEIAGEAEQVVYMTPQQARAFASELIQTVYKAEVKSSLQRGHRRQPSQPDTVVKGSFPSAHIAGAQQ